MQLQKLANKPRRREIKKIKENKHFELIKKGKIFLNNFKERGKCCN